MSAGLIMSMVNKLTMLIQEIDEQVIKNDEIFDIKKTVEDALNKAVEVIMDHLENIDLELAQAYQHLNSQVQQYMSITQFLIQFIESMHGPLGGAFPLITDDGYYLMTDNGDFLVTA